MSSVSTSASSVTTAGRAAATSPKTFARSRAGRRADRVIGTQWACLVLAPNTDRREVLERSARDAGWTPIVCAAVAEANELLGRWRTQLAAIDLGGAPAAEGVALREFTKSVASRDRLLAVIDDATTDGVELWARQAGAWVYLPAPDLGLTSEGKEADLTGFFSDAREAAEKLAGCQLAPT